MTLADSNSEVYACGFSPDDLYLACGYGDGSVKIFNTEDGTRAFELDKNNYSDSNISALKWRPLNSAAKTPGVIATTQSSGLLKHWHVASGQCLHKMHVGEEDNQLFTLDYNYDGSLIAVAGKDHNIYLFDETEKVVSYKMDGTDEYHRPHSNRVFSVKFNPFDRNMLVSGGWDANVNVYDIRARRAVHQLFGPNLSGEAIDIGHEHMMLTGSYVSEEALQVWDLRKPAVVHTLGWGGGYKEPQFKLSEHEKNQLKD